MQFVSVCFSSGSYVPVLMAEAKMHWQMDNYGVHGREGVHVCVETLYSDKSFDLCFAGTVHTCVVRCVVLQDFEEIV